MAGSGRVLAARRDPIWFPSPGSRTVGFTDAGWSSSVARWAHNPEVAGSNPAPATIAGLGLCPRPVLLPPRPVRCVRECESGTTNGLPREFWSRNPGLGRRPRLAERTGIPSPARSRCRVCEVQPVSIRPQRRDAATHDQRLLGHHRVECADQARAAFTSLLSRFDGHGQRTPTDASPPAWSLQEGIHLSQSPVQDG